MTTQTIRSLLQTIAHLPNLGLSKRLVRRGNGFRESGRYAEAGALYEEALKLVPGRAFLHIQCGHMLKEAGDVVGAERHYMAALRLTPRDPDLWLQLGHFRKTAGQPDAALAAYRHASELQPDWAEPLAELEGLRQRGMVLTRPADRAEADPDLEAAGVGLLPELAPRPVRAPGRQGERIRVFHLGRRERTPWGVLCTLRGVEALRGFALSLTELVRVELVLDPLDLPLGTSGTARSSPLVLHDGPLGPGIVPSGAGPDEPSRKHVFNLWFDLTPHPLGRYRLELRLTDAAGRARHHRETVVLAAPLEEADYPDSNSLVSPAPGDLRPIDEQINARPSMVKPVSWRMLPGPVRSVLVLRTDQLGDMVVSIPAVRRLRELFPEARFVGLLTTANADFARTLGLFDEVVEIEFPDSPVERQRTMTLAEQARVKALLQIHRFDVAVDLCELSRTRSLMALSGAPFQVGFQYGEVPGLALDVRGSTHDRLNTHDVAPHANKLMGLVEWLGAALHTNAVEMRRPELTWELLAPFGLDTGTRYCVLHMGASLLIARWPGFLALARLLLARTGLTVVLVADSPTASADMPPDLVATSRVRVVSGRLPFDRFDALLSFAAVFVGNDSGPKHLASLRGTPVVSLHMARTNWSEWAQGNTGVVITRRVPCAGCGLHYEPEECGRSFVCLTRIEPEEVFAAVQSLLDPEEPAVPMASAGVA